MVDIFGKDKTTGSLSRLGTLQLDGCPVQIEALSSDQVSCHVLLDLESV